MPSVFTISVNGRLLLPHISGSARVAKSLFQQDYGVYKDKRLNLTSPSNPLTTRLRDRNCARVASTISPPAIVLRSVM